MNRSPAKPLHRIRAFAWDYLIILGYAAFLGGLTLLPGVNNLIPALFDGPVQSDISAFVMIILPIMLYFTHHEGGKAQATWGKRRVGIQVHRATGTGDGTGDGTRVSMGRAFVRTLIKFLPWQLGHTAVFQLLYSTDPFPLHWWILTGVAYGLVALYLLMLWLSPRHQTPYDLLAGTIVVN